MSLMDKIKSLFGGGASADTHDHAGHDHSGHDHDHSAEAHSHEPVAAPPAEPTTADEGESRQD